MADPLISVIIPTYNGATRGFLSEAIESVLAQTYGNFELIIVDDGSTDGTRALCEQYMVDSRVRVLSQRNRGLGAARNLGIENSSGEFICLLDDDDLWKPEKLEVQLAFMQECLKTDPETGMVYHGADEIDRDGAAIGLRDSSESGAIFQQLLFDNVVNTPCTVMILKRVFGTIGYFAEWKPLGVEDLDFWLRLAKLFRVHADRAVLADYRVYPAGQMSGNRRTQELGMVLTLWRAMHDETPALQNRVYGSCYRGFAMWHFREGDYSECRRCYVIARHYGPVGWRLRVAFWAAHFPVLTAWLRRSFPGLDNALRRNSKKKAA